MEQGRRDPNTDLPEEFGKYTLVERLAVGGVAEIYRAKTTGIGGFEKTLVIKRLHNRLSRDDEFIDMLVDEARIAVQLNHPNIGKVFDLGRIRDQYYIAMEYIEGPDLGQVIEQTSKQGQLLPIPAVLFIGAECCSALHYAHTRADDQGRSLRIVHRDISPPNIMLSVEGEVKIVDFGIAKARKQLQDTQQRKIKGKFHYMAPEQASGQPVDARTDVYSVGMVLYELLGGRNPYEDVPESEMVEAARAAQIPSLRQMRPELDPEIEQLVMRALSPNPENRFRNAADFDRALTDYRERKCDPYDRRRLSSLVGDMWEEMDLHAGPTASPDEETGSMTPYEFEPDESSLILDVEDIEIHSEGHLDEEEVSGDFQDDDSTAVWEGGTGGSNEGGVEEMPAPPPQQPQAGPSEQRPPGGPSQRQPEGGSSQQQLEGGAPRRKPPGGAQGGTPQQPREITGSGGFEELDLDEQELPPPPDEEDEFQPVEPDRSEAPEEIQHPDGPERSDQPYEPESETDREPQKPVAAERIEDQYGERTTSSAREDTSEAERERTSVGTVIARLERAGIDRRTQLIAAIVFGVMIAAIIGLSAVALWPDTKKTETIAVEEEAESEAGAESAPNRSGRLRIESTPPKAEVEIDGEMRGETPLTAEGLDPEASYEIELRREGYQIANRSVQPSEISDSLDVEFERSEGVVKVSTYPPDAKVELDGEMIGYSPVTASDVRRSESHRLRATLNGKTLDRKVEWEDPEPAVKEVRFDFEERKRERTSGRGGDRERGREQRRGRAQSTQSQGAGTPTVRTNRGASQGSRERGTSSKSSDDSAEKLNLFGDSEQSGGSEGSEADAPAQNETSSRGSSDESKENLDIWGSEGESETSPSSGSGGAGGGSSESGGPGSLSVQVKQGWGKVYIDGKEVAAETPLINHELGPGTHKVKVHYPVLKKSSEVRTIQVESGESKRVIFDP